MPCVISVHRWMLGLAPSRCRRSPSASVAFRRRVLRRLQAGARIADFWPEHASQRFPSRLAPANTVAHSVVLRSLAGIVAARLWSALAWLLEPVQTPCITAASMDLRGCSTWASRHSDSYVWAALTGTDALGAAQRSTRRWKVDSDARDQNHLPFYGQARTPGGSSHYNAGHLPSSAPVTRLGVRLQQTNSGCRDTGVFVRRCASIPWILGRFWAERVDGLIGYRSTDAAVPGASASCL